MSAINVTENLPGIVILQITQEHILEREGTRAIYVDCLFLKAHARTHSREEKKT